MIIIQNLSFLLGFSGVLPSVYNMDGSLLGDHTNSY